MNTSVRNTARGSPRQDRNCWKCSKMKAESNYVLALRKMQQDKTAANPNPPKTNQHEENCYKVDGYLQQNPFCAQICVDNSGEGRRAGAPAPAGSAGGGTPPSPRGKGSGRGKRGGRAEPASLEGGDRDNDAVPVALRRHLRAAGTQDDGWRPACAHPTVTRAGGARAKILLEPKWLGLLQFITVPVNHKTYWGCPNLGNHPFRVEREYSPVCSTRTPPKQTCNTC